MCSSYCCFYCIGRYYCLRVICLYKLYSCFYLCVLDGLTIATMAWFFFLHCSSSLLYCCRLFNRQIHIAYLIVHWKIKNPWVTKNAARIQILTIITKLKRKWVFFLSLSISCAVLCIRHMLCSTYMHTFHFLSFSTFFEFEWMAILIFKASLNLHSCVFWKRKLWDFPSIFVSLRSLWCSLVTIVNLNQLELTE